MKMEGEEETLFVSCQRDLRKSGKALKIELKSLVGRSLRYTLNSEAGCCIFWLLFWMASNISLIMDSVLGPHEHPKSAMPKLLGVLVMYKSSTASMIMCFTRSLTCFCNRTYILELYFHLLTSRKKRISSLK